MLKVVVCVVGFGGLHSKVLVCKLQYYTVNVTVLFCSVYSSLVSPSVREHFHIYLSHLHYSPKACAVDVSQ